MKRISHFYKFLIGCATMFVVGCFAYVQYTGAATLAYMGDTMTQPLVSELSDHSITFVTPTGVDDPTDTITIAFPSFTLGSVVFSDIDMTHGTGTGLENTATLAATAAAGTWGVGISGTTITFTAPTDAAAGEIAASSTVKILIGTNATGGVNQITNPATSTSYVITIGGTFGDSGSFGVVIVDDNQVAVTAEFPVEDTGTGGGSGGSNTQDSTPPTIFNVQSVASTTSAIITWQTDEGSTSAVDYGQGTYTSGTVSDLGIVYNHQLSLTGLATCTQYQFRIRSSDESGNEGTSSGHTFTTSCDTTPPVLSNIRVENITDTSGIVMWSTNEPATSLVQYGLTTSYGQQGSVAGLVTSHSVPLAGLLSGTIYHYRVISSDALGNTTTSTDRSFSTLADTTPPANPSLTATAGDATVSLTWTLPADPDFAGVRVIFKTGGFPANPFDGTLVYTGTATSSLHSGLTNGTTYFYGAYSYDTSGNYSSGALAQATPTGPPPEEPPPEEPPPEEPPPEEPPPEEPPPEEPPPTVPPEEQPPEEPPIVVPPVEQTPGTTIDVNLYGAGGTLPLTAGAGGVIGVPANTTIFVSVPAASMNGIPDTIVFEVGGFLYNLRLNVDTNAYEGTFTAPSSGTVTARGQAVFTDGRVAEDTLTLRFIGGGRVYERPLIGAPSETVSGARVTLFAEEGGVWAPWNAGRYGQANPQTTNEQGVYVFWVPPGRYYAEVERDGYRKLASNPVFVDTNVYNQQLEIIKIPKTIQEVIENITSISATTTPIAFSVEVAKAIGEQVSYQVKKFQEEIIESPAVQEANTKVVSPTALTVTVVNAASAFSVFNFIAYLQYLFTQPLLLLWRRKRKEFGVVYNSLTKRPVDLAIIRLVHTESGRTVQTRVTDKEGRYFFQVKPGTYHLEVVKPNYLFPSTHLTGRRTDVDFVDLYFGGSVKIEEESSLALNIPLDPTVSEETPRRILFKKGLRRIQHAVAFSGVFIAMGAFFVTPTPPMALFIASQVVIYMLFRKLSIPKKPKKWGVVYDTKTKKPLSRAIVRIFDSKFNKMLETQVTDSHGRYGFLVGKNVYYLTGEAKGYAKEKLPDMDLTRGGEGVVDRDIALKRERDAQKVKQDQISNIPISTPPQKEKGKISEPKPPAPIPPKKK